MLDMGELMKKAQELSQTMQSEQEKLAQKRFDISVGGEMVQMTFNGKQELLSLTIDPEVVDPEDVETLRSLILSAVNEGIRQSQQGAQSVLGKQLGGMVGGMDLSAMFPKS